MKDPGQSSDEPRLFDLPLEGPSSREERKEAREGEKPVASGKRGGHGRAGQAESLPLFPEEPEEETSSEPPGGERPVAGPRSSAPEPRRPPAEPHWSEPLPTPVDEPSPPSVPGARIPAGPGRRWRAGLTDLAVHAVVLLALGLAGRLLGADIALRLWPGFAFFLLVFSFLYSVIPLAFWGRTPGMALAGVIARNRDGQPLTFGQVGVRWAAGLVTALVLGLPSFLALIDGRSLTDRLSGSVTYRG